MTRALIFIATLTLSCPAGAQEIVGAGSDEHVWFATVEPGGAGRVRLYHHALDMGGPYFRSPMTLVEAPAAMVAAGDQAWIVFDVNPKDAVPRREVCTIHARRNPATGWYFYEPEGALSPLPPLPTGGALAGAAATAEGLAVLIMPRRRPTVELVDEIDRPTLLVLKGNAWVSEPLPEPMKDARLAFLTNTEDSTGAGALVIAAVVDRGASTAAGEGHRAGSIERSPKLLVMLRRQGGSWLTGPLIDGTMETTERHRGAGVSGLGVPATLFSSQGRAILGLLSGDGSPTRDEMRLGVIRRLDRPDLSDDSGIEAGPGRMSDAPLAEWLPFVTLSPPHQRRLVVGTRQGLLAIERRSGDMMGLRVIDGMTGLVGASEPMVVQPLSAAGRVYLPLLLTALTGTMLVVILVRPLSPGECRFQPGSRPAELTRRLAALGLDVAPCLALSLVLTGANVTALGHFPLWAPTAGEAWPLILATALLAGYSFVCEVLWGRTIGKALLGLRVARVTGEPPGVGRLFVRNLVKAIVLLLPPLMILVLLNAYRQQLGDIVAGTVVVEDAPELRESG